MRYCPVDYKYITFCQVNTKFSCFVSGDLKVLSDNFSDAVKNIKHKT